MFTEDCVLQLVSMYKIIAAHCLTGVFLFFFFSANPQFRSIKLSQVAHNLFEVEKFTNKCYQDMEGNVKISLDIDPLNPVPAWSPFTVDEVVVVYGRPFSTL